jgi:hypothetical protein
VLFPSSLVLFLRPKGVTTGIGGLAGRIIPVTRPHHFPSDFFMETTVGVGVYFHHDGVRSTIVPFGPKVAIGHAAFYFRQGGSPPGYSILKPGERYQWKF